MTDTVTVNSGPQTVATEQPPAQLPTVIKQERKPRAPAQVRAPAYPPKIAKAIIAITNEIGTIQKEGFNEFQKYRYTRWEDISEKLSPLLSKHGLVIVQTEVNRTLLEQNDKGSTLCIIYHFTIVDEDGGVWPPVEWTAINRLRDQKGITDDKAASKCHTQAEKQFVIKLFKIRSDDGYDDTDHHAALPKKNSRPLYQQMENEMDAAAKEAIEYGSLSSFLDWGQRNAERKRTYPKDWQEHLTGRFNDWRAQIDAALQQRYPAEPEEESEQ